MTDPSALRRGPRPRTILARLAGAILPAIAAAGASEGLGLDAAAASGDGWEAHRIDGTPLPLALETFDAAWTLVHETHFDPDFNGVDWNAVRAELRPRAAAATDEAQLRDVISEMLGRLGQSHFALIPGEVAETDADDDADRPVASGDGGGNDDDEDDDNDDDDDPMIQSGVPGDLGVVARLVDDLLLVVRVETDGPAARAGIAPGFAIRRIDGTDVDQRIERTRDLDAGVRQMVVSDLATSLLEGDAGREVRIAGERPDGTPATYELRRRVRPAEIVRFGNLPPMPTRLEDEAITADELDLGLIRFNIWMGPIVPAFAEAIDRHRDADGLVIDLRGNPGGIGGLAMGVAGHLLAEKRSLGTLKTRGAELQFNVNPQRVSPAGEIVSPFAGPVAILIDAGTASTSEIFAGGLQALGRVRVFGETSMGAALPSHMNRLPNGDVLLHAFADFLIADGTSLEGRGVVPDEIVPLDRARLARGEDPPLAAAKAWIARSRTAAPAGGGVPPLRSRDPETPSTPAAESAASPSRRTP